MLINNLHLRALTDSQSGGNIKVLNFSLKKNKQYRDRLGGCTAPVDLPPGYANDCLCMLWRYTKSKGCFAVL